MKYPSAGALLLLTESTRSCLRHLKDPWLIGIYGAQLDDVLKVQKENHDQAWEDFRDVDEAVTVDLQKLGIATQVLQQTEAADINRIREFVKDSGYNPTECCFEVIDWLMSRTNEPQINVSTVGEA